MWMSLVSRMNHSFRSLVMIEYRGAGGEADEGVYNSHVVLVEQHMSSLRLRDRK